MKVSVCLMAYNHERFIDEAIQSVLAQKTNFDYEIVIGEDSSQDNTREILISYAKQYPEKIRLLFTRRNLGPGRNFVRTYQACEGDYIATLDGDDYWTVPYKLQNQVDFMDSHPEYSACFHVVKRICEEEGSCRLLYPRGKKRTYTLKDYARGILGHQCSMMFRNRLIDGFPDWYYRSPAGDWVLQVLHAERGDVGFIDQVTAVYRIHAGGLWSSSTRGDEKRYQAAIGVQQLLISHVSPRHKPAFKRYLYKLYYNLSHTLCDHGDWHKARGYAQKCWREWGYDPRVYLTEPLRIYAHLYMRPLYQVLRGMKRRVVLGGAC